MAVLSACSKPERWPGHTRTELGVVLGAAACVRNTDHYPLLFSDFSEHRQEHAQEHVCADNGRFLNEEENKVLSMRREVGILDMKRQVSQMIRF